MIVNPRIWKLFYNNYNGGPEIDLSSNTDIYSAFNCASNADHYEYSSVKENYQHSKFSTTALDLSALTSSMRLDDDTTRKSLADDYFEDDVINNEDVKVNKIGVNPMKPSSEVNKPMLFKKANK